MRWLIGGRGSSSATLDDDMATAILPHLDAAHNLARWLVRDAALAEDVVQDAVVRALSHQASYQGRNARAWFMRIVRNVAYDALAAGRRWTAIPVDDEAGDASRLSDPGDDPEHALVRLQDHAALGVALDQLAPDLRECLVLRELEALSYREIAEITGVPVGTVMSRLWRARRALIEAAAKGTVP